MIILVNQFVSPPSVWFGLTLSITVAPAPFSLATASPCVRPCNGSPFTARISSPRFKESAAQCREKCYVALQINVRAPPPLPAAPRSLIQFTTIGIPCSKPPFTLKSSPLCLRCRRTVLVPRALFILNSE